MYKWKITTIVWGFAILIIVLLYIKIAMRSALSKLRHYGELKDVGVE